jgi:hypothetical protein
MAHEACAECNDGSDGRAHQDGDDRAAPVHERRGPLKQNHAGVEGIVPRAALSDQANELVDFAFEATKVAL